MSREWKQPGGPSPEQLAAFADGELQGSEHEQVAAWLLEHPDVSAEVDGSRRLMRLWEATAAPSPSPLVWDATLNRIESAPVGRTPPASPFRSGRFGTAVAVAVVVLALLTRPLWDVSSRDYGVSGEPSPFPVATAQDVTILSMDGADIDALVVGQAPILGDLDLADHGDVTLLGRGDIRLDDWGAPMIVDPLALVAER